jgi:hypothetical protein
VALADAGPGRLALDAGAASRSAGSRTPDPPLRVARAH